MNITTIELNGTSVLLFALCIVLSVILSMVVIILNIRYRKKTTQQILSLESQVNASELLADNLLSQLSTVEKNNHEFISQGNDRYTELEQVTKQLEHRIKKLTEELDAQKTNLITLQSQQPEDRLYTRALKLVKLGASVDEIMNECDLPQAEAEILLAIHNQKS